MTSGDTTPCKMTGVTSHGVLSPGAEAAGRRGGRAAAVDSPKHGLYWNEDATWQLLYRKIPQLVNCIATVSHRCDPHVTSRGLYQDYRCNYLYVLYICRTASSRYEKKEEEGCGVWGLKPKPLTRIPATPHPWK